MLRKKITIAVIGPTASGKSELAVKIAKRFNGEIISADSRQVYRELNIGTGKIEGYWKTSRLPLDKLGVARRITCSEPSRTITVRTQSRTLPKFFIYKKIPHHCIDFVSPKKVFTVADFKKCAETVIKDILERGKIPILCGGTGFYIDSVLYDLPIPNVPPNRKLRAKLSKKSAAELYQILKKLDPKRAKTIDQHNPRRLIRAIEIIKAIGKTISQIAIKSSEKVIARSPERVEGRQNNPQKRRKIEIASLLSVARNDEYKVLRNPYNTLILGIKMPKEKLYKRIDQRLEQRLKQGMIQEVKKLLRRGISHKRLQSLGLEYRFLSFYLQKKLTHSTGSTSSPQASSGQTRKEMIEKLKNAIHQYAKRQMTWFKRNKQIQWIPAHNIKKTFKLIRFFLKKSKI